MGEGTNPMERVGEQASLTGCRGESEGETRKDSEGNADGKGSAGGHSVSALGGEHTGG